MIEVLLTFLVLIINSYFVESLLFQLLIIVVLLMLILPGIYSMLFGAPFIPTSKRHLEVMVDNLKLEGDEEMVELGCGDGRVIRRFSNKVNRAIGLEFSLPTFLLAKVLSFFSRGKEKILFRNFWRYDFSDADVLVFFLLGKSALQFEKKIWPTLSKGTVVVSNQFKMLDVEPYLKEKGVYFYRKIN